jgi:hypothetical protein
MSLFAYKGEISPSRSVLPESPYSVSSFSMHFRFSWSSLTLLEALLLSCLGVATAQAPSAAVVSPRYELAVKILPDSHRLEASGTLRLASSDTTRKSVQVLLSESMRDFAVEVIEPRVSRGRPVLEQRERPGSTPGSGSRVWTIVPPAPFPAGQPVLLRFSWAGGNQPGFVFYLGPEGSLAGGINTAWYPQVLDPSGGTSAAIGGMDFRVPKGYTVIASGAPVGGLQTSGEFRFVANQPTHFAFAAGKYTVLRREGAVPMAVYLLRPREKAETYLDGCTRILEVLVREYGPHPYGNRFAVVEVPTEKLPGSSGASFENFILANSASMDAPFNPVFFGHEIGHIWWGNLIKQKGERGRFMLDEGMAQYSALIALEHLEGPRAAEQLRRHGDPASPIEHSASTYFALAAGGLDHPLSRLPAEWNSRNLASSKGPLVMDLLARTIGQDRFRAILRRFTSRHAFTSVTWDQFVEAFDEGTAGQYRWFFSQWFDRPGAPDWRLTWVQEDNTLRGVIAQEAPFFRAVVDVEVADTSSRRIVRPLEIQAQARTDFSWNVDLKVRDVTLDPEFRVLHWTPPYQVEAPLLAPYWQAFVKEESNQHDAALAHLEAALQRVPADDTVGVRFMLEELTARLLAGDSQRLAEAKAHLERGLMSASRRTERLGWAYFLLGYIASSLGDRATLQTAIEGAVASDAMVGSWSGWGTATQALRPATPDKQ